MDNFLHKVDGQDSLDSATDFVDTFYSYQDTYYETNAGSVNGDDELNIIDLYADSRPSTPSDLSSNETVVGLEEEDLELSCNAASEDYTTIYQTQKLNSVSTINPVMQDKNRSVSSSKEAGGSRGAPNNRSQFDLSEDSHPNENEEPH